MLVTSNFHMHAPYIYEHEHTGCTDTSHVEDRTSRLQECEIVRGPINLLLFQVVLQPVACGFQSQFRKRPFRAILRRLFTGELTPFHSGIFTATACRVPGTKYQGECEMVRSEDFVCKDLTACLFRTPVVVSIEKP